MLRFFALQKVRNFYCVHTWRKKGSKGHDGAQMEDEPCSFYLKTWFLFDHISLKPLPVIIIGKEHILFKKNTLDLHTVRSSVKRST